MFGLRNSDLAEIRSKLREFPEVEEAWLYGSRAKGNQRAGSDVDLALKGQDLNYSAICEFSFVLNEKTLMPYNFDVLDYSTLTNQELIRHIKRVGKLLYQKSQIRQVNEPEE